MRLTRTGLVLAALLCAAAAPDGGAPVTVPNARQYDFTSKVNGQRYRLFVYVPPGTDPAVAQPVAYVLDGNWYFGTAADAVAMDGLSGIVVAVGYPSDDWAEVSRRRTFDLSLPLPPSTRPATRPATPKYGGGDAFLHVVDAEVKPFIAARYPVDPARQALIGQSLGGLMVLRQLFRDPAAYSAYVAASPSIWWNARAVLRDEPAFDDKAAAGGLHVRVLVTSAADEQYHGADAKVLARSKRGDRMVDNASELAARLSALAPAGVSVTRAVFPDESHRTGAQSAVCRGLRFALPPVAAAKATTRPTAGPAR